MKNILILLLVLCIHFAAKGQQVLDKGYFIFTEEGFQQLKQSNDTLYILRCSKNFSCDKKTRYHYKILSTKKIPNYTILKLERLDSISLTLNPYPEDRFSVLTLKDINKQSLSYIQEAKRFTRSEIDTLQIQQKDLDGKFGFTYYSEDYLTELGKRKQINTKKEIEEIIKLLNKPEYQAIIQKYKTSGVIDMYAIGLTYELLHKAVIESGFNPIDAREKFNQLMR